MLDQTNIGSLLSDKSLLCSKAYVAGDWVDADDGATFAVTNPARGDTLTEVADLGVGDVRRAIDAAAVAQKDWAARTAKERAAILRKWHDLMVANADDLGLILTAEMGKPLAEAKGEILYGASFIEWFAEEGQARLWGDDTGASGGQTASRHQAAGRCCRFHHPLEFPQCHDRAKGGTGAGGRLRHGCAAR